MSDSFSDGSLIHRSLEAQVDPPYNSPASFQYTPLDDGQIRVLEIFAGRDPILRCGLQHRYLREEAVYEALSYAWEGDSATCVIELNGKQFMVHANLYDALVVFRQSLEIGTSLLIWIDAVCINQSDNEERAGQVRLMGKIYETATRLRIWLGSQDIEGSELALAIFETCSHMDRAEVRAYMDDEMSLSDYTILYRWVWNLFHRPWFYRAWIVQEYVLSPAEDKIFYYGQRNFPEGTIRGEVLAYLQATPKVKSLEILTRFEGARGHTRWLSLANTKESYTTQILIKRLKEATRSHSSPYVPPGVGVSLLTWLNANRNTKSSEPRDKVFSVVALTGYDEFDPESLIINYDTSVQYVFSSVVHSAVSKTKRLNIFGACSVRSHLVLRSWTPDWTMPSLEYESTLGRNCGEYAFESRKIIFQAARDTDAVVTFASNLTTMTVRGWLWDKVQTNGVHKEFRLNDAESEVKTVRKRTYRRLWERLANKHAYESEREAKASLWRTLLLDCTGLPKIRSDLEDLGLEEPVNHYTPGIPGLPTGTSSKSRWAWLAHSERRQAKSPWHSEQLLSSLRNCPGGGKLLLTCKGYIGKTSGPEGSVPQDGDLICILLGSHVPIILRPFADHYELVRDVYIDGIMFGEAMDSLQASNTAPQDFVLH